MIEYVDLHVTKTTFKSGRIEYYLDESPASSPFEPVIKEETVPVLAMFKSEESR